LVTLPAPAGSTPSTWNSGKPAGDEQHAARVDEAGDELLGGAVDDPVLLAGGGVVARD
jgi:hypothetical protein